MPPTSAPRTARERARADITTEITASARRQLAEHGAAALSLRAVARTLGMVSSAVYRYFASRDDLLTALIIESYDALARRRWRRPGRAAGDRRATAGSRVAVAIRAWAQAHPHEYALLYGSPVPGYARPPTRRWPAPGPPSPCCRWCATQPPPERWWPRCPSPCPPRWPPSCGTLRATVDLDVDDEVLVAVLLGWTQLFGLLGFELFGQTRGVVEDHGALFTTATTTMAAAIGLW
jgi:AcrR family transcriptional regulator